MNKSNKKIETLVIIFICYIFVLFLGLHFYKAFLDVGRSIDKPDLLITAFENGIKQNPIFIPNKEELKVGLFITMGFCIFALLKLTEKSKNYMPGIEHGSARWGTDKERNKLKDKNMNNNIVLSNEIFLSLNTRKTRKNLNVCILGGSGAGKTRFYVKPNLMKLNTSYIVTDPKGDLFRETGYFMKKNGYNIKVFNTKEMTKSMKFNPFRYIKDDTDIFKLIKGFMKNTDEGKSGGDAFWDKAESALLSAVFFYLYYEAPEYEQNLPMVSEMLDSATVKEEDEDFESDLDTLFKELEEENPKHIAVRQYNVFKSGAGKTGKSILISAKSRLAFLSIPEIANLLSDDELELEFIGDTKTILYVIIPDDDSTYNFLIAMLYTQLFSTLYDRADNYHKGRLPIHVRAILDEFANIGEIPDFEKKLATMRSREISANIILQSIAQLKGIYEKTWESIVDNCDSTVFLGGQKTAEYVSKKLGKATIDNRTINQTKGRNSSSSINNSILARDLMTADEVEHMPDSDSIVFIRGQFPFYTKKYEIEKDKNYKYLGSNGEHKNNFYFEDLNKISKEDVESIEKYTEEKTNEKVIIQDLSFDFKKIEELEYELEYEKEI